MYDIRERQGVFGRWLAATSGANRYRDPSLPPGEGASRLEGHLLRLERHVARRIAEALGRACLTRAEREILTAKVLAFLSNRSDAKRTGAAAPDPETFRAELDALLGSFDVLEPERREVLTDLDRVLNDSRRCRAA